MELSLKRNQLLPLGKWLNSLSLYGPESRERTKFVELLDEELKEQELTRVEIVKRYCKKEEGTDEPTIITTEDGSKKFDIPDDKLQDFQKELVDYLNTDFTCGGPGLKNRLTTVKTIVLNPGVKIEPENAQSYDKWCEAFEEMKEE